MGKKLLDKLSSWICRNPFVKANIIEPAVKYFEKEKRIGNRHPKLLPIKYLTWTVFISLAFAILGFFKDIFIDFSLSSAVGVIPAIAIGSGVLIAILTFQNDQVKSVRQRIRREKEDRERDKRNQEERNRNHSQVFLERAIIGFDESVELLKIGHGQKCPEPNRVTWIHAAMTLLHAQEIGSQINSPEYKKAYELEVNRTRGKLHQILQCPHHETYMMVPLPAHFFYGLLDWHNRWAKKTEIDEIAKMANNQPSSDVDGMPTINTLKLDPNSIVAIYDFMRFPKDFPDLVSQVIVWDKPWSEALDYDGRGAREYVLREKPVQAPEQDN